MQLSLYQHMLSQISLRIVITDDGEATIVYLHNLPESQQRKSLFWINSLVQIVVEGTDIIHQFGLVDSGQSLDDLDGDGKVVNRGAVPRLAEKTLA